MEFKEKLIFARARLNLTQADLADLLKVSYPTVNRWENGHVRPTRKAEAVFEQFCCKKRIRFPEKSRVHNNNE